MQPDSIPEPIITRFRSMSLERVGRVEAIWNSLLQGTEDDEAVRAMSRDLHTLKGDARIVGYDEVHKLTHRLEELVGLAGQLGFRVSEDFELVVSMATQFLGMLLRKRDMMGIDLDGFLRQVDDVIRETRVLRRSRSTNSRSGIVHEAVDRLSDRTRQRLADVATQVFLEYLSARHTASRARLRNAWQILRDELSQIETSRLEPLLERHIAGCKALAAELGKKVEVEITVGDLKLDTRVAEAVDQAILHLVRNAVDHGIETSDVRVAAGKGEYGTVRVQACEAGSAIEIVVADDGRGIDLDAVRARGVEHALIDAGRAGTASERELLELVFLPGFTTKREVGEVSGRGVGMDVVKSTIGRVGGEVRVENTPGAGLSVRISVPAPSRQIRVYRFLAPGGNLNFAISARWTPTIVSGEIANTIDPVGAVALHGGSRQTNTQWTEAVRDLVMKLRWGFLELAVRTATEPVLVTAERVCPTSDDSRVEVVLIDGLEALLLRPEHVAG